MNEFMQMEIFFFISSIAAIIVLLFGTIVGLYLFLIVKKVNAVAKEFKKLAEYSSQQGKDTLEMVKTKIEDILNHGGATERIVATALGTIIAKTFRGRGKMSKDAPKKRTRL
jgi:hypothetical protein